MGLIETIGLLYLASIVVVFLHELGHMPRKIHFTFWPFPSAAAMHTNGTFLNRIGGLIVNAIIFTYVFKTQPEHVFIQYVGLIAWLHFIYYMVFGSFNYEPKENQVNNRTYVWDDVPNESKIINLIIAGYVFWTMYSYYFGIAGGII